MRTNLDIDGALLAQARRADPYKSMKDAAEAGFKPLDRRQRHVPAAPRAAAPAKAPALPQAGGGACGRR